MSHNRDRLFLWLAAFEGALALAWLLLTPTAGSQAFFMGLSRTRLALAGLIGLAGLGCLLLAASWPLLGGRMLRLSTRTGAALRRPETAAAGMASLGIATLLGLGIILWKLTLTPEAVAGYYEWLGPRFSTLNSLAGQALPLIAWGTILAAQAALGLAAWFRGRASLLQPGTRAQAWKTGAITLLAWLVGSLTLFHWMALSLSLTAFTSIPGWHWALHTKPVTLRHLLFVGLGIALVLLVRWLLQARTASRRHVLALVVFGYAVQVGMGVADGRGIESLREKYFSTLHRSYVNKAVSRDESVLESIRRYEEIYSNMLFPSTKPPGVMAIYISLDRSLNALAHKTTQAERYDQLTSFITAAFPLVSLATIPLIYLSVKRLFLPGREETRLAALLAPLLFLLASNIVLFPLFLDQAFYPWLFLGTGWLALLAVKTQKWTWALLAGAGLYATVFFSFSLLPVLALPILYAAIQAWTERSRTNLLRQAGLVLAVAGGLAAAFLAFRWIFNYDFFARYANAMSVVYNYDFYSRIGLQPGEPVSLGLRVRQVIEAALLNNLDFASLISFPVFALFLGHGVKVLRAILLRQASAGEMAQGAFFLAYLALNAVGQMSGEAGRLWMFLVPPAVILAAVEIAPLARRQPWAGYAVVLVQFVTLLLTYQFQDLIF